MINVPNTLSSIRLIIIPVFCILFLLGQQDSSYYYWSCVTLAVSALSDLLDGYFARKLNQITELGKWLDPIADKLTLGAVVVCMWIRLGGQIPVLHFLFALFIVKDAIMGIGGLMLFHDSEIQPAQWWGKIGTGGFYAAMLGVLIVSMYYSDWKYHDITIIFLVSLSLILMVFALICYIKIGLKIKKEKNIKLSLKIPTSLRK